MCDALMTRINQRRNVLIVSTLYFLNSKIYPVSNSTFKYANKSEILFFVEKLYQRLFYLDKKSTFEPSCSDTEELKSEEKEMTESEKLKASIKIICSGQKNEMRGSRKLFDNDFKVLEIPGGERSEELEKIYKCLLNIKPSSVMSERVFSVCTNVITKVRNRLMQTTLMELVYLKYYYFNNGEQ